MRRCDDTSIMEVFKYFTKLTAKARDGGGREVAPPWALDVIFRAMRGRRVWQPVGVKVAQATEVEANVDDDELELVASPAFKRVEDRVLWLWEQELTDWVDLTTGESLSGYAPSEGFRRLVEGTEGTEGANPRPPHVKAAERLPSG